MVKNILQDKIVNSVGAGLCLLDKNLRIIWLNKQYIDWFGPSKSLCGKHCYNVFEHRRHICRGCPTLKVFQDGEIHTAKRIGYTKKGKGYFQLTVSPVKDNNGKVILALELAQDTTAKILQEKSNFRIMKRLHSMCERISSVNTRLRTNIERLKGITKNLRGTNRSLANKYKKKEKELSFAQEELKDILKLSRVLSLSVDTRRIASLITKFSCELINVECCMLWLIGEDKKMMRVNASYGMKSNLIERIAPTLKLGESLTGKAALSKKVLQVYDIDKNPAIKYRDLLRREGARSILAVPIIFQNKTTGVISVYSRNKRRFSEEEIRILSLFASQAAVAIQESRYCDDIHLNYFNTIHTLVLAIEARDPYTRGHTERVTKYSIEIARNFNMSREELEVLRYAAEVHDIGKISIPDFILNKPGRLTSAERAMIELHPIKGAEILEPLDFLKEALPIVRHHHERYDGTGYPDGLDKDRIPIMARIITCADSFDAMTSERPYRRRKLTVEEAITEIRNNTGSQFDPRIASNFIKLLQHSRPHYKKNALT
jgi:putative nucleotidyltransferase with HDIG domain